MKYISYCNRELRWIEYRAIWGEEQLNVLKEYLKRSISHNKIDLHKRAILEVLNQYSWNDIVEDWEEWNAGGRELIMVEYPHELGFNPEPLARVLDDYMNEDAWNASPEEADRIDFERDTKVITKD